MKGGDVAMHMGTGQARIVVAFDAARNLVTFCGDAKWHDARQWRTHVRPSQRHNDGLGEKR